MGNNSRFVFLTSFFLLSIWNLPQSFSAEVVKVIIGMDAPTLSDLPLSVALKKDFFRPEFLNRVDDIIIFDILPIEAVREIVKIQIDLVRERLAIKEISLELSDDAYEFLAKEGYNPQFGARPLKRVIQNKILNQVANLIISKGIMKGGIVSIGVKKLPDGKSDLTFDIKKGRRGAIIEAGVLETASLETQV